MINIGSGGGNFDEKGVKIGTWTELDANFNRYQSLMTLKQSVNNHDWRIYKWK
jgi:hypothetical protein